jgi:tryptophan halogenase
MESVRSIIVLGGGTAGFLAAIALRIKIPQIPVKVIRSKEIGIIGVGEGTTVTVPIHLHGYLGLDIRQFYDRVQPIWKLGIHYLWGPRDSFHFTFGPNTTARFCDLTRPMGFYMDDCLHDGSLESSLMKVNRAFRRNEQGLPQVGRRHAYHLENRTFVGFLEGGAIGLGVQIIEDTVTRVEQSERGVERLHLASGNSETADLFVDCSGFASELIGKTLGEPFVSYSSSLFCDRAVVGGWKRQLGELIQPYTVAETMNAGWCWRIDHEHLINRGYVFSSDFLTDQQAEEEFRTKNPKVQQTRIVKFRSGRVQRSWVKNVVAIGNAGGFVEPLEATAIGAICEQTQALVGALDATSGHRFGPKLAEVYSTRDARYWDAIRRFLAVHYKYNTRLDTPFWREAWAHTDLSGAEPVVDYYQECGPDCRWSGTLVDPHDQFGIEGYLTMLIGQQVPYRFRYEPTAAEIECVRKHREEHRRNAMRGYRAEEALAIVRMPKWEWNQKLYAD